MCYYYSTEIFAFAKFIFLLSSSFIIVNEYILNCDMINKSSNRGQKYMISLYLLKGRRYGHYLIGFG